jgi:uncharacterized protein
MKFVLVILVVLAGVWLWRRNRAEDARDEAEAAAQAHKAPKHPPVVRVPTEVVSCRHCGLHLPAADAVAGTQGAYCSQEHLRQHEA